MLRSVYVVSIWCVVSFAALNSRAQSFTEVDIDLPGICCGNVAWGDYDRDGDLDLLITGINAAGFMSRIYRSEEGPFGAIDADLPGVYEGAAAWADFDGDDDLDLVLTGTTEEGEQLAQIYRNNDGGFSDVGAALTGANFTALDWKDDDQDGDLDLLINGRLHSRETTWLYRNENGIYTEVPAQIEGGGLGSANWIDYDQDGDLDMLITGRYFGPTDGLFPRTRLYRNDSGVYVDTEAGLIPVYESASAWGDYDNDGDLDVVLTGLTGAEDESFIRAAQLYNNDSGSFIPVQTDIMAVSRGSVAWGDYDNDGDLDLVVTGTVNDSRSSICYLYRNEQGDFIQIDQEFPGIADGQAIWGDYDTDGDLDLLIAGEAQNGLSEIQLYRNFPEERNEPPDVPTQLHISTLTARTATLCWDAAQDDTTPQQALSYNMRVGTGTRRSNVMPSMSLLQGVQEGQRLVVGDGNLGQGTCTELKGLTPNTTYFARVQAVDHGFAGSVFSEELIFTTAMGVAVEEVVDVPEAVQLDVVYPNPFRTSIEIRYTLAKPAPVSLVIYDILGREVDHLIEQWLGAGTHSVTWEAGDLSSGMYLYQLTAGDAIQTKQVVLLK